MAKVVKPETLFSEAIRGELGIHACILACCEFEHTEVVGVIHEVLDRIQAGDVAARVTTARATVRRTLFSGGIRHLIAASRRVSRASALERVIKTHPVSDFMRRSVTLVVRSSRTARQRRE